MIVSHNLSAMNAQRQYNIVGNSKAKSVEKLSSGYRINRAADDAAGLAISEKMRRQIRGLTQAVSNCQDGISMVQTADGALAEVHEMLDRCSELSVKAANGTLTDTDRGFIQTEIAQIKDEIDKISDRTTFNELQLLKGREVTPETTAAGAVTLGGLPSWVQESGSSLSNKKLSDTVTIGSGATRLGMEFDFSALDSDFDNKIKDLKTPNCGFYTTCCTCDNHYSVKFVSGKANSLNKSGNHYIYEVNIDGVTSAADLVNRIVSATGGNSTTPGRPNNHYTSLEANGSKLLVYENRASYDPNAASHSTPSSNMGLIGPGVAYAAGMTPDRAPVDIFIQADVEPNRHIEIKLPTIGCKVMGIDDASVDTASKAQAAIDQFKHAKEYVSGERSRMGAYQNRLEHTVSNLNNVVENTTAAESQIRDTDMALEMVNNAQLQILLQAGEAMMSQANQSNQGVLTLLG